MSVVGKLRTAVRLPGLNPDTSNRKAINNPARLTANAPTNPSQNALKVTLRGLKHAHRILAGKGLN